MRNARWNFIGAMRHIDHACVRTTADSINRLQNAIAIHLVKSLARLIEHEQHWVFDHRARQKRQTLLALRNFFKRDVGAVFGPVNVNGQNFICKVIGKA